MSELASTQPTSPDSFDERFGIRLYKEYFNFGSAHFLIFADSSREELHGHNYRATLEIDASLDDAWLVADFLIVKPIFRGVCDSLDHRTLLPLRNPHLKIEQSDRETTVYYKDDRYVLPNRDVCLLDIENTASELLAKWICEKFLEQLSSQMPALKPQRVLVSVQESRGQSAIYERRWQR
ncbi:MAG TPA: hypothetical protein DCQ06_14090 [Myxococcales bacterium]|nr:hypothetical protein [Myxococcales bacterium]